MSRIRRHILLADENRNARRTIADALEILCSKAGFDEGDCAHARIGWLKLSSAETVGLVQVVFDAPGNDTVWVVSLPSSREFRARCPNSSQRSRFDIAGLDGAIIDSAGTVLLTGGASLHSVEIIPAKLPYPPSELDTLSIAPSRLFPRPKNSAIGDCGIAFPLDLRTWFQICDFSTAANCPD